MLRTPRLILRAARQSDVHDLFAIYGDPKAMRFWSTAPHADLGVTQEAVSRQMAAAQERLTYFVIEMDGRAIGNAGMYRGDEVGFILHPDFWRQGIVKEAMTAIIPYLFEVTDVAALTADIDPRNEGSAGILRSLGFHETGRAKNTYCINGEWSDSLYFALPRPASTG
ncbi:GNAT family N-acetyltransferase [Yoonia litorea]|uniref:Ribosomal-protein-alanine N-acetyltransferase n=1 Tax=Yoonia litorea TaxID=1123755 RepID=A0A1I6MAR6_9RHOB|nr:GNAT family N-acetyltransferase [Yoonia litorea]SFS12713.1 ribosomal-protein-alanine N-acetyltransferase [Yoonia litorea]